MVIESTQGHLLKYCPVVLLLERVGNHLFRIHGVVA
jgi:hypothetical protein